MGYFFTGGISRTDSDICTFLQASIILKPFWVGGEPASISIKKNQITEPHLNPCNISGTQSQLSGLCNNESYFHVPEDP